MEEGIPPAATLGFKPDHLKKAKEKIGDEILYKLHSDFYIKRKRKDKRMQVNSSPARCSSNDVSYVKDNYK